MNKHKLALKASSFTQNHLVSLMFDSIYTQKIINLDGTRVKTENICHIVDLFANRYLSFNKDSIKLNSRILKKVYGSNYPKYIGYLIDHKFICLHKNYSVGRKSKTFKLTPEAKAAGFVHGNVNISEKLLKRAQVLNDRYEHTDIAIKLKLVTDLNKVRIDLDGAMKWIDSNLSKDEMSYHVNMNNVAKIARGDIYHAFDKYGRFHTNFTTLKREIRERFLTMDGCKIHELDIKNSQPFFLYILLKRNGFKDWDGFDLDVLDGVIYDRFVTRFGVDRKQAKVETYKILFGRNRTKTDMATFFKMMYPSVYEWMVSYKREVKSYKVLAGELQKIESHFVFNALIPELLRVKPDMTMITIHDSVIIPETESVWAEDTFLKVKESFVSEVASGIDEYA